VAFQVWNACARLGCRVEFGLRGLSPVLRYLEDLVTVDR
jgi:hypothetical protein